MSNLISSFIIDPVVRQARRFSTAYSSDEAHSDRDLSHATPRQGTADHRHDEHHEADTAVEIEDDQHADLLGTFRRYSTFIRRGRPASRPRERAAVENPDLEALSIISTAEETPLGVTTSGRRSTTSLPIHGPADRGMSQNPTHGIPQGFRPLNRAASTPVYPVAAHTEQERRDRAGSGGGGNNAPVMSELLPADDGMRHLRRRIHEIRDLTISNDEKARMMHYLMTERYHLLRPQSPVSLASHDRPFTPSSTHSLLDSDMHASSPISMTSDIDPENPYNLRLGDTQPSYRTRAVRADGTGDDDDFDTAEDGSSYGCQHYKRNVKVQCHSCHRWYTCRHCHDTVEDHSLNRKMTKNMLCMACGTPQPAGQHCRQCGREAAWYYCAICKLWDDNSSRKIYHCEECGICRMGEGLGKDYVHCKRCNVCISIAFAQSHRCVERATECDCPICGDYLFSSSIPVVSMPCGHYLHKECYNSYMQTAYKCPMCKKSAVNMELQWRKLTHAIESQPMPEEFADTRAVIQCNDCSCKSSAKYHWLGNKCTNCDSYNTNELRILSGEESDQAAEAMLSTEMDTAPNSPLARPSVEIRAARPYFLSVHSGQDDRSRASTAEQPASLPYQLMERMSRSLSPLRNYLSRSQEDISHPTEDEDDDIRDRWGTDGRFLSGAEDSSGSDSDSDSDESLNDADGALDDDEADDANEDLNDFDLVGHP